MKRSGRWSSREPHQALRHRPPTPHQAAFLFFLVPCLYPDLSLTGQMRQLQGLVFNAKCKYITKMMSSTGGMSGCQQQGYIPTPLSPCGVFYSIIWALFQTRLGSRSNYLRAGKP